METQPQSEEIYQNFEAPRGGFHDNGVGMIIKAYADVDWRSVSSQEGSGYPDQYVPPEAPTEISE